MCVGRYVCTYYVHTVLMFHSLFQVSTDSFSRFVRLPPSPCELVLHCVSNPIFNLIIFVIELKLNVQYMSLK